MKYPTKVHLVCDNHPGNVILCTDIEADAEILSRKLGKLMVTEVPFKSTEYDLDLIKSGKFFCLKIFFDSYTMRNEFCVSSPVPTSSCHKVIKGACEQGMSIYRVFIPHVSMRKAEIEARALFRAFLMSKDGKEVFENGRKILCEFFDVDV